MKRKIGLIIAVVFAVALSLFASKSVSATGANGDIYCSITYGDKAAKYKQCAYVLTKYHKDELKEWGCSELSKTNTTLTDSCRIGIRDHIKYNLSKCTVNGGYENTVYNCTTKLIKKITDRIAKGEKSNGKAGMPLDPKCYTTAHENDSECTEKESDSNKEITSGSAKMNSKVVGGESENCTTLFASEYCTGGGSGITKVISFILAVLTGTVVVAGTVGIIICGVMIMTARDNEVQLAKGKKRLLEVVIGIIAWVLLAVIANLFIPRSSSEIESGLSTTNVESIEERKA